MMQTIHFAPVPFSTSVQSIGMDQLVDIIAKSSSLIIADQILKHFYQSFFASFDPSHILWLPAGEAVKSAVHLESIYAFLLDREASRHTDIYVFGGGTICDIASYAVSTFKRGCLLHLIPTTLIGMVDAALGGKTALNFHSFKNMIGTFYPAKTVYLIPQFLHSLPLEERRQGWAEIYKLYLIQSTLALPIIPADLIPTSEEIYGYATHKLKLCAGDLYDKAERQYLNLGHSFAHAMESISEGKIKHGDAVYWGMLQATHLSRKLALIDECTSDRIIDFLRTYPAAQDVEKSCDAYKLSINTDDPDFGSEQQLLTALRQDKKNQGQIRLILFCGWRKVLIHDMNT